MIALRKTLPWLPALIAVFLAAATPSAAGETPTYRELSLGSAKAKLTIIEYASLTCPHCAAFAVTVLPQIKKTYIDTGKVRLVFRDMPTDPANLATAAAMLARCAPEGRGMALIETLFQNQRAWVRAERPIEPLTSYAQTVGMSGADIETCLQSDEIFNALQQVQETAVNLYKVEGTPTFIIGEDKFEGDVTYAALSEAIDKHLK